AACGAGSAVLSALVLWLAVHYAHPTDVAVAAAGLAVLVPLVFGGFAWRRSLACGAGFAPALEKAWVAAAADIARARGGTLDAAELAKQTRIAEREADQLLARMSAR